MRSRKVAKDIKYMERIKRHKSLFARLRAGALGDSVEYFPLANAHWLQQSRPFTLLGLHDKFMNTESLKIIFAKSCLRQTFSPEDTRLLAVDFDEILKASSPENRRMALHLKVCFHGCKESYQELLRTAQTPFDRIRAKDLKHFTMPRNSALLPLLWKNWKANAAFLSSLQLDESMTQRAIKSHLSSEHSQPRRIVETLAFAKGLSITFLEEMEKTFPELKHLVNHRRLAQSRDIGETLTIIAGLPQEPFWFRLGSKMKELSL